MFLPSLRLPRFADQYVLYGAPSAIAQMASVQTADIRDAQAAAAIPVLRALQARGARLVFEAPTPMFDSPGFRCADWFDRENPICHGGDTVERAMIEHLRAPVLQAYARLSAAVPDVYVWDPLPVLCPGSVCSAYRDGRPLLFDGDHLSGYGDAVLFPSFLSFIENLPRGGSAVRQG